jgi:DNA-binding MurR/RpiR family transcriptional regulator
MNIEFQSRIKLFYHNLSKKEKSLADYLIDNSLVASRMSIQEISKEIGISVATTSRFAQKIGYRNFQEMKLSLHNVESNQHSFFTTIEDDDSFMTIAKKTFRTSTQSLSATLSLLSEETLKKAFDILQGAKSLAFFGLGGSSVVSFEAYHKFMRTSLNCFYSQDYHIQLMKAAKLSENDAALVISHTGQNREILQIVDILKKNKVPIICVTSFPHSNLAKLSDVALISVAEETHYRPESLSSTVAQMSLIDSLFLSYANHQKSDAIQTIEKIREVINTTRV